MWDYKTINFIPSTNPKENLEALTKQLRAEGIDGWELVTVVPLVANSLFLFIFKRPADQK